MTDNNQSHRAKRKDEYEPPQAERLNDTDRAYGACSSGSTPTLKLGYRVNHFDGVCVTGKSATHGCRAGASGAS